MPVVGQGQLIVKEQLQSRWQMAEGDTYQQFDAAKNPTTIYFNFKPAVYSKDYLVLKANQPFSVLLNNVLVADGVVALNMPIDSLAKAYATQEFFFAIHSKIPVTEINLSTHIHAAVLIGAGKPDENYLRSHTPFRDFSVTAVLLLVIFFVIIIRLNPGLSSDLFSIRKVFSFRENEDDHHYYRVTSATILFYVFTSALLSFYLLVIAKFVIVTSLTASLADASYWMMFFIWVRLSLYLVFLLFIKITLVYLISTLFGVRTIAGYHFFNFVRMLLITLCILTVVLVVYYIPHGQRTGFYQFLYTVIPWILGSWIVLGFFKLASRIHHSAFHLFSYICITELLPFLLILKVLNT
jgi:hypothetical protein